LLKAETLDFRNSDEIRYLWRDSRVDRMKIIETFEPLGLSEIARVIEHTRALLFTRDSLHIPQECLV